MRERIDSILHNCSEEDQDFVRDVIFMSGVGGFLLGILIAGFFIFAIIGL